MPIYGLGNISAWEVKRDALLILTCGYGIVHEPSCSHNNATGSHLLFWLIWTCSFRNFQPKCGIDRMTYYVWFNWYSVTICSFCVILWYIHHLQVPTEIFSLKRSFCSGHFLPMAELIPLSDLHNTPIWASSWPKQNFYLEGNIPNFQIGKQNSKEKWSVHLQLPCKKTMRQTKTSIIWTRVMQWKNNTVCTPITYLSAWRPDGFWTDYQADCISVETL